VRGNNWFYINNWKLYLFMTYAFLHSLGASSLNEKALLALSGLMSSTLKSLAPEDNN
jgi:hypothetical protein